MKKLLSLILATVLSLSLVSCGEKEQPVSDGSATSVAEKKWKEEVVIGWGDKNLYLDPQSDDQNHHQALHKLTHEGLVTYYAPDQEVQPKLAESWKVSDDGLTYTFKLIENAVFSNGEPLTSDDVVFTFERAKAGCSSTTLSALMEYIDTVAAVDEHTVEIRLIRRNSGFLVSLGSDISTAILNREAVEADPEKGAWVGTGRWIVDEFVAGETLSYVKNNSYYGELPPTEKLRFLYISDENARVIAQESGDTDVANYVRAQFWEELESYDNQVANYFQSSSVVKLWLNTERAPLNDPNVRRAIAYAIDYEGLILGGFDGGAVKADTNWCSNQFGHFTDWNSVGMEPYEYNLEKAKEYLAKSNYPDGCSFSIGCSNSSRALQGQIIQASLKKVGIEVTIDQYDSATYIQYANEKKLDAGISGGSFAAPGESQRIVYEKDNSENRSNYYSDEITALFDRAVETTDEAESFECYKQIQMMTHEDVPMVPMVMQTQCVATVKGTTGVEWSADPDGRYDMSMLAVEILE